MRSHYILLVVAILVIPITLLLSVSDNFNASKGIHIDTIFGDYFIHIPFISQDNTINPSPMPSPTSTPTSSIWPKPTATSTPTSTPISLPGPTATPTSTPTDFVGSGIIIDHTFVGYFEQIPDDVIVNTSQLNYLQMHASTGGFISLGLDYLQGTRNMPGFPSYPPYKYDRRNWNWPLFISADWTGKLDQFVNMVETDYGTYDVMSMKFCYDDYTADWESYRDTMLQLENDYPGETFVWWTMPLRNDWSRIPNWCEMVQEYNSNIRQFATENDKILFDIADIESHDPNGNLCYEGCETMCAEYGDGHPREAGAVRLAKSIWVLMAKIAGWDGE